MPGKNAIKLKSQKDRRMNSAWKCYTIFLNTFSYSPLPWGCPKIMPLYFQLVRHLRARIHGSGDSQARHRLCTKASLGPPLYHLPLKAQNPASPLLGHTLWNSFRFKILRKIPPSLLNYLNWGIFLNRFLHRSCFADMSKSSVSSDTQVLTSRNFPSLSIEMSRPECLVHLPPTWGQRPLSLKQWLCP